MTEFRGSLGNYKILKTKDNTCTLYSEYFDEACHNLSGAYEETIHNYILGCEIADKLNQKNEITVLDVGFGAGLGLKALIDLITPTAQSDQLINYFSIELDEILLEWTLKHNLPELLLEKKTLITNDEELKLYQGNFKNKINIAIFIGDGRQSLPGAFAANLLRPIDAIFQDPFSPKKNPTLWTTEWFLFLKQISSPTVNLATYSSSISIRKSLVSAGWCIENAKGFALKKTMTKAKLKGQTAQDLLDQLARSPSLEIKDK